MPLQALISPSHNSNAGAVASRYGYRYQDHVAASFVLEMIRNSDLNQIECETADDIVLRWNSPDDAIIEYVQVKTTEIDNKWSIKELTTRDKPKNKKTGTAGTSLVEKSLGCDRFEGRAIFRFVTQRDVGKTLKAFTIPRQERSDRILEFNECAGKFAKTYIGFKSPMGKDIRYWANNLYWQVESREEHLIAKNMGSLTRLAEGYGQIPSTTTAESIYVLLLKLVAEAADAPRDSAPHLKAISRDVACTWWEKQMDNVCLLNRGQAKVYMVKTPQFFTEFHSKNEFEINRRMHAYDTAYDLQEWRGQQLIDYALQWLPEVALSASVLAEYHHLDAMHTIREAVAECDTHGTVDDEQLLSQLLIHAILRHCFKSEPIACKIFTSGRHSLRSRAAHIIKDHNGDQLWLGRSKISTAETHEEIISSIVDEIKDVLTKEILREERNIIVRLREPSHMQMSTLDAVLSSTGKLEDILKALHVPVLIAYDSNILSGGFTPDYVSQLIVEAESTYEYIKSQLPNDVVEAKICIFLIPVLNASQLITNFGVALRNQ